jgi:hypothetical protein
MFSPYKLSQPTSLEPAEGWTANDRVVFLLPLDKGMALRKGSIRLNATLQLWRSVNGGAKVAINSPITGTPTDDKIALNPNCGANGVIKMITTMVNGQSVENIIEFSRLVALKNEAEYYQLDHAVSSDAMMELMGFSNDGQLTGLGSNQFTGMKFPIDASSGELPFSLDLDFCLNNSNQDIPSSKVQNMEVSIQFQDINKSGIVAKGNVSGATYSYNLKRLEMRYMTAPEVKQSEPLIMEIKSNCAIPSVYQSLQANLTFAPAQPFNRVFAGFLDSAVNPTNALTTDYLKSEALPLIDYLEIKVNNSNDDVVQFPLRFQTVEILYNYLHAVCGGKIQKHGLTYSKLGDGSGYGLGLDLVEQVPAGTNVQFNINFKTLPQTTYRSYWYSIGNIEL